MSAHSFVCLNFIHSRLQSLQFLKDFQKWNELFTFHIVKMPFGKDLHFECRRFSSWKLCIYSRRIVFVVMKDFKLIWLDAQGVPKLWKKIVLLNSAKFNDIFEHFVCIQSIKRNKSVESFQGLSWVIAETHASRHKNTI